MANNINWYPGHMKKTKELIQQNQKLVDVFIELIDARIPLSSSNSLFDEIIKNKTSITVMNKSDLADSGQNVRWMEKYRAEGKKAVLMNSAAGDGVKELMSVLHSLQKKRDREAAFSRPFRIMIVGVPNAGKSSLINRLAGRRGAQVGNRPGVTRGKQWLTVGGAKGGGAAGNMHNTMQLLDTPGILEPRYEKAATGRNLAICGSIKDEITDSAELAVDLIDMLRKDYPELLAHRYGLEQASLGGSPLEIMETIAGIRGFIFSGGRFDYERTSRTLLDEFRKGKIGRITLERPEDAAGHEEEKKL